MTWVSPARADDAAALAQAIAAARDLAGADAAAARAQLKGLRDQAIALNRIDLRLGADEVECRLLGDADVNAARQVAVAGVAQARASKEAGSATRLALLRLRACGAGVLFDMGESEAASAELEAVLAEAAADPALQAAQAMALVERGLHRSRRGELTHGQEDLLGACATLERLALPHDIDLCLWHLAGHFKRVGDSREALRLMERLIGAARQRGAVVDEGVYAFGMAQVRMGRGELAEALTGFERSLEITQAAHDGPGVAYAESGVGSVLLGMGRAGEALPHIERSLALLEGETDKLQVLRSTIQQATALSAIGGRAQQAAAVLAGVEAAVRADRDQALLASWLAVQATAMAQLGRWHEAYQALSGWRDIDARQQSQRQSEQSARLRMQFNREKDENDLRSLERANAQGQRLRSVQALAIGLFVVLLGVSLVYASHKIRQARRLQTLALTDELTGLPNRRAVLAHAADMRRGAPGAQRTLGLLMIDVDHFKHVNDTWGHAVGDEVLRHLAQVLGAGLRTRDRLGRLGGEEFLVVLPEASLEHALVIAERMRLSVAAAPCELPGGAVACTVSIGVATLVERHETVVSALERADQALYRAKAGGRDRVCSGADAVQHNRA